MPADPATPTATKLSTTGAASCDETTATTVEVASTQCATITNECTDGCGEATISPTNITGDQDPTKSNSVNTNDTGEIAAVVPMVQPNLSSAHAAQAIEADGTKSLGATQVNPIKFDILSLDRFCLGTSPLASPLRLSQEPQQITPMPSLVGDKGTPISASCPSSSSNKRVRILTESNNLQVQHTVCISPSKASTPTNPYKRISSCEDVMSTPPSKATMTAFNRIQVSPATIKKNPRPSVENMDTIAEEMSIPTEKYNSSITEVAQQGFQRALEKLNNSVWTFAKHNNRCGSFAVLVVER